MKHYELLRSVDSLVLNSLEGMIQNEYQYS